MARELSVGAAWKDVGRILAIAVSRLALVLGIVIAEDLFNWAADWTATALHLRGSVPGSDLSLFVRLALDALDLSLFVAVVLLAAWDIGQVLVATWRRPKGWVS
jgi:hypothetical protein